MAAELRTRGLFNRLVHYGLGVIVGVLYRLGLNAIATFLAAGFGVYQIVEMFRVKDGAYPEIRQFLTGATFGYFGKWGLELLAEREDFRVLVMDALGLPPDAGAI